MLLATCLGGMITGIFAHAESPRITGIENEKLKYDIVYNWGIIWKKGAEATLSTDTFLMDGKPVYKATLSARTTPFADKIFRVRDTLYSVMHREHFLPLYYAKIADEKKVFRKDELFYHYDKDGTQGRTSLIRPGNHQPDTFSLFTPNRAFDMLSIFYYIRRLDFGQAEMGERFPVEIFSGRHVEKMEIEYLGRMILSLPGNRFYPAYKVKLRFFGKTGEKVNENMTAWISEDPRRIPLMVEGRLPVGSLKAFYSGK